MILLLPDKVYTGGFRALSGSSTTFEGAKMRTLLFSAVLVFVVGLLAGWAMAEGTARANIRGFGLLQAGRFRCGLWTFRRNRVYFRLEVR